MPVSGREYEPTSPRAGAGHTRQEIERSGAVSMTEVMCKLPVSNRASFNENDPARGHGAGAVALRGLSAGSTLVLINGRRVAVFGFGEAFGPATFVDINQIPIGIVDRVEILLDGAGGQGSARTRRRSLRRAEAHRDRQVRQQTGQREGPQPFASDERCECQADPHDHAAGDKDGHQHIDEYRRIAERAEIGLLRPAQARKEKGGGKTDWAKS